jgi:hypothetical protein
MTTRVARSSRCGLIMGVVFVLCAASPARSDNCSVVGNFLFTSAGGRGTLALSADGRAAIDFVPSLSLSEFGLLPEFGLDGTYRTLATDRGCQLTIDLTKPNSLVRNEILGMVAFEGRVLLFRAANMPEFGNGLGLRIDTFTGQ